MRSAAEFDAVVLVDEDHTHNLTILLPEKHLHAGYLSCLVDRHLDFREHGDVVCDLCVDLLLDATDLVRRDPRKVWEIESQAVGGDKRTLNPACLTEYGAKSCGSETALADYSKELEQHRA